MNIYTIDQSVGFPGIQTPESKGHDIAARIDVVIPPRSMVVVPCNLVVRYTTSNSALLLFPRSSLFKKTGCIMVNGVGLIDQDYSGPEDELLMQLYNTKDVSSFIRKGDRIGQFMLVSIPSENFMFSENNVDPISRHPGGESRGGVGSTGGIS